MKLETIMNVVVGTAIGTCLLCVASLAVWATLNVIVHGHLPG